jgi:hypothetical protein
VLLEEHYDPLCAPALASGFRQVANLDLDRLAERALLTPLSTVLTAKFGIRIVPNHRSHGKPKLSERKMKVI